MSPSSEDLTIRPYRNGDSPGLAQLWNRAVPDHDYVARPLTIHELDLLLTGRNYFDPADLLVAVRDDQIVGYAHTGFGPVQPEGPSHRLDPRCGCLAMLLCDPGIDDRTAVEQALIQAGLAHLRERGADVIYAGGRYPVNPFYWGIYGGSEFAGILDTHHTFHEAVRTAGFEPAYSAVLFASAIPELKLIHPKALMLRSQTRLDIEEDAQPARWWDAQALTFFPITRFRLLTRSDETPIAEALVWEMNLFLRDDPKIHAGLVNMEVAPDFRRRGYGRALLIELARYLKDRNSAQEVEWLALQTDANNQAAIGLYRSLGFGEVGSATLYRLPGRG